MNTRPPNADAPRATLFDHEVGHFYFGYWKNVSLIVWVAEADEQALHRLAPMTERLVREYPGGHSNLSFVLDGVLPPRGKAKEVLASLFAGGAADLRCVGIVLEGVGFWASALRSPLTNAHMSSSSRLALRLSDSREELASWLASRHQATTGTAVTPDELMAIMTSMRDQLVATMETVVPSRA